MCPFLVRPNLCTRFSCRSRFLFCHSKCWHLQSSVRGKREQRFLDFVSSSGTRTSVLSSWPRAGYICYTQSWAGQENELCDWNGTAVLPNRATCKSTLAASAMSSPILAVKVVAMSECVPDSIEDKRTARFQTSDS